MSKKKLNDKIDVSIHLLVTQKQYDELKKKSKKLDIGINSLIRLILAERLAEK
jgi:hypothetical protein